MHKPFKKTTKQLRILAELRNVKVISYLGKSLIILPFIFLG